MNNIILNGETANLQLAGSTKIMVNKDSTLNAINLNNSLNLDIKILDNQEFTFNSFEYRDDIEINLNIEAGENSKFYINMGFIANSKYDLTINTNLYGSNIIGSVNIRGVNELNGQVKILMNGTVAGETHENVLNEYARVINKSEYSNVIIPNLIVNTNDVLANHGASIGTISEEELFYIMSKGISKINAEKLIEEGFLLSIFDEENKDLIKNILIGR
jgi:hypothetical protein